MTHREITVSVGGGLEIDRAGLVGVHCQRLYCLMPLLHAYDDLFKIVAYQNL